MSEIDNSGIKETYYHVYLEVLGYELHVSNNDLSNNPRDTLQVIKALRTAGLDPKVRRTYIFSDFSKLRKVEDIFISELEKTVRELPNNNKS